MSNTEQNRETSKALWQALYERDWDKVGSLFAVLAHKAAACFANCSKP